MDRIVHLIHPFRRRLQVLVGARNYHPAAMEAEGIDLGNIDFAVGTGERRHHVIAVIGPGNIALVPGEIQAVFVILAFGQISAPILRIGLDVDEPFFIKLVDKLDRFLISFLGRREHHFAVIRDDSVVGVLPKPEGSEKEHQVLGPRFINEG
ncbi:hypothetical protein D1872_244010 [compost metagenome]